MAIHKKLLEFQKLGITLKKDGSNPHFKSSYVTLNEVLEKVKEPLNKLGVVIVQSPYHILAAAHLAGAIADQQFGLKTELVDTEDDSTLESFTPFVNAVDMQKLGGAITYARRYSLISMLGLEDSDDDGNSAVSSSKPAKKIGVTEQEEAPFNGNEFEI